jgi:hypothetical protein
MGLMAVCCCCSGNRMSLRGLTLLQSQDAGGGTDFIHAKGKLGPTSTCIKTPEYPLH